MNAMNRIGALSGVAYVLLINIGVAVVGEDAGGAASPGQRILDEQQRIALNPWTGVALALIILALLAFMMFVGYLCWRLRTAGWLAATALIGGTTAMLASLISLALIITVYVLRDNMSPELARALIALDGAGHMVQLLTLGVYVLFASAGALVTRTLGRALSWGGMVIGAISILVLAASGLPANDESLFPWPFLLVMLWMTVISLRLTFARNRDTAPITVPATAG